jgi:hypothetical protein
MDKGEKQNKHLIYNMMVTTSKQSTEKLLRYILGSVLILVAINAFGGGYYGMAGAKNVPVEWLKGSPFHNYFIPGLFLFIVIGGSALISAIAVFRRHHMANKAALICGIIILLWLAIQVAIIGYISWLQPTTAIAAIFILILSRLLLKYEY